MGDQHSLDTGSDLPGFGPISDQNLLREEGSEGPTLWVLRVDVQVQQHCQLVIANENLGGVTFDQPDTAPGVGTAIEKVPSVDEVVPAGLEVPMIEGILNELRVAVSIGYDERSHW